MHATEGRVHAGGARVRECARDANNSQPPASCADRLTRRKQSRGILVSDNASPPADPRNADSICRPKHARARRLPLLERLVALLAPLEAVQLALVHARRELVVALLLLGLLALVLERLRDVLLRRVSAVAPPPPPPAVRTLRFWIFSSIISFSRAFMAASATRSFCRASYDLRADCIPGRNCSLVGFHCLPAAGVSAGAARGGPGGAYHSCARP